MQGRGGGGLQLLLLLRQRVVSTAETSPNIGDQIAKQVLHTTR